MVIVEEEKYGQAEQAHRALPDHRGTLQQEQ
jgi:hypothetical protein